MEVEFFHLLRYLFLGFVMWLGVGLVLSLATIVTTLWILSKVWKHYEDKQ